MRWSVEAHDLYVLSRVSRARAYEALQERLVAERSAAAPATCLADYDVELAAQAEKEGAEWAEAARGRRAEPEREAPPALEPDNFRLFRLYVDSMEVLRRRLTSG